MKKKFLKLACIAMAVIVMSMEITPAVSQAASNKQITVMVSSPKKAVKQKGSTLTIYGKKTVKLTVKQEGKNITSKAKYKSSKPKVVSVRKSGKLVAKNYGTAKISIKYKGRTKKINVIVAKHKQKKRKNTFTPNGTVTVKGYIDKDWQMKFLLAPYQDYGSAVKHADQETFAENKRSFTFKPVIFNQAGRYRFKIVQHEIYIDARVCNCGAINFDDQHSINHILKDEPDNYWITKLEVPDVIEDDRNWYIDVVVSGTPGALNVDSVQYWTIFDDFDNKAARFKTKGPAKKPDWPPKVEDNSPKNQ